MMLHTKYQGYRPSGFRHEDFHLENILSGRVLDSRPKGRGFEPHRCHSIVVLEQDTFILA